MKTHDGSSELVGDEDIRNHNQEPCVLTLDSGICNLAVLRHPEVALKYEAVNTRICKVAAGFTESGSPCDSSQYYKLVKSNVRKESCIEMDTSLKRTVKNLLERCQNEGWLKLDNRN